MESGFYDGIYVKKEGQNGIASFASDHEVKAMRREQRKCEESVKVINQHDSKWDENKELSRQGLQTL